MADEIKQAKLRAVYNAIDSGNYKSAIKLCGRKDISSWDLTKALLSYCYANIMRTAEALSLAHEVLYRKPTSPIILTPLKLTFKILHDWNAITVMYEGALEKDSTNLDHAHELFCCYARTFQPEKMKQLAQSLYRATSRINYLFWSVASMLHGENVNSTILLLSERMIKKVLCNDQSNIQPGAEEIHLLVDVIRRQGRHEEALQMLDELIARPLSSSPSSNSNEPKNIHVNDGNDFEMNPNLIKMTSLQLKKLRCELLLELNQVDDHDAEIQSILKDYPDNWLSLKDLENLRLNNASNKEEAIISHQNWLIDHESLNPRIRGPLLAQLSLLTRLESLPSSWRTITLPDDPENVSLPCFGRNIFSELIHHIVVYIHRFCNKQCCYSDLKPYLIYLTWKSNDVNGSRENAIHLIEYCNSLADYFEGKLQEKIAMSQDNVDAFDSSPPEHNKNISTVTATPDTRNEYLKLVTSVCKLHQISLFLEQRLEIDGDGKTLSLSRNLFWLTWPLVQGGIGGEREVQPCDEFGLLVSTIHRGKSYQLQQECDVAFYKSETFEKVFSTNTEYFMLFQCLIQWISDLEKMCTTSQYNYMFPLEMLCPYRSLAAGRQYFNLYEQLNVRHVQLDSMTYLILPVLIENGLLGQAHLVFNAIGRFHKSAKRDTNEMIARSLQYGNYMKSFELSNFNGKIKKSLVQALFHSEAVWLQIVGGNITRQAINKECDTFLHDVFFGNKASQSKKDLIDFINSYSVSGALAPNMNDEFKIEDNSDYDLLIRLDAATNEDILAEKKLRKNQLRDRVLSAQALINVCATVLNEDWDKFQDIHESLNLITKSNNASSPIKWSQTFECPPCVENAIDGFIKSLYNACSAIILASTDITVAENIESKILGSLQCFLEHIESLRNLTKDSAIYLRHENQVDANPLDAPQLLRSQWIHGVSSFCIKGLPLSTIILGCVSQFHPSFKVSKKKGKTTNNNNNNPRKQNITRMIVCVRDLVADLNTSVDSILASSSKKCNFDAYAHLFEIEAASERNQSDEDWQKLLQNVLTSHLESCDEFSRILKRFQSLLNKMS